MTPRKKVPKKAGCKGKYADWIEPQGLAIIESWSRNGLTNEQICQKIGIRSSTLYEWQKRFPEISEALKNGREASDLIIENALYKKAVAGDMTAIIFYLKNRRPKLWRDRPAEMELEEAKLMLEQHKIKLEMMKTQLEITRVAKLTGMEMPDEINLENLTDDEIKVLMSIIKKSNKLEEGNATIP